MKPVARSSLVLLSAIVGGCSSSERKPSTPVSLESTWQLEPPERTPLVAGGCEPQRPAAECIEREANLELSPPGASSGPEPSGAPRRALQTTARATGAGTERPWWEGFGDSQLNRLIESALGSGYQEQAARARLAAARSLSRQQRARRWPQLDAQLTARRSRQVANFPDFFPGPGMGMAGGGALAETFESESYTASLEAAWQLPLWGRVGAGIKAAELNAEAALATVHDTRLALVAELASAYFDLLEAEARRRLLREQLRISRTRLELVRTLFEQGLTDPLTLQQQRQSVASTSSRLAELVGFQQLSRARLGVLLGQAPSGVQLSTQRQSLPEVPSLAGVSISTAVVAERPDVVAARKQLEASSEDIAARIRERLPSLSLTGSIGLGGTEPEETFDNRIWSAVATLTQPLWHGGRISAQADQAEAVRDQRLAEYADTLVQALADVESALGEARRAEARSQTLAREVEAAKAALSQAEQEFENGLVDFLNVLDAERTLQLAQLSRLSAHRQRLAARVALHSALGTRSEAVFERSRAGARQERQ